MDYYPDSDEQEQQQGDDQKGGDEKPYETALLPKSIFGGGDVQPGQTIMLKVEAVHEDEVEVCPADEKEEKEDDGSEMDRASNRLSSLGQPT